MPNKEIEKLKSNGGMCPHITECGSSQAKPTIIKVFLRRKERNVENHTTVCHDIDENVGWQEWIQLVSGRGNNLMFTWQRMWECRKGFG